MYRVTLDLVDGLAGIAESFDKTRCIKGSRCCIVQICLMTLVCTRERWVVCFYDEVSKYEVNDVVTHDSDFELHKFKFGVELISLTSCL